MSDWGMSQVKKIILGVVALGFVSAPVSVWAAVNLDAGKVQKLKSIKESLSEKEEKVDKLNEKMSKLESLLGKKNERYVKVIKIKQQVESEIYQIRQQVKKTQNVIKEKLEESEKALTGILLNKLSEQGSPSELLSQRLLKKELKERIQNLRAKEERQKKLVSKLDDLKKRFSEYHSIESELSQLLARMEGEKKQHANKYLKSQKEKERLLSEYETLKAEMFLADKKQEQSVRQKVGDISFSTPLEKFVGMKHKEKGVTFRYRGKKPVLSTASGTVAYRGKLSTYGNVVMIDHGNDTRSILLGKFLPRVQKGSKVAKGDILGHTQGAKSQSSGELYFEVRKHNKAQNTILLLDRDKLLAQVSTQ